MSTSLHGWFSSKEQNIFFIQLGYSATKWRHSKQDMLLFNTGCRVLWQHSLLHYWQLSDTSQRIHPHSTLCCWHATLTALPVPVLVELKLTHNDNIVEQSLAGFIVIDRHSWVPSSHDLALFHSLLKFTMENYMGLILVKDVVSARLIIMDEVSQKTLSVSH